MPKSPEEFEPNSNETDETKDDSAKEQTVFEEPELSDEEIKKKIEELKRPLTPEEEKENEEIGDEVWKRIAAEFGFDPNPKDVTEEQIKGWDEQGKKMVEEEKKRDIARLEKLLKKRRNKG